jgi:hypothetical protein
MYAEQHQVDHEPFDDESEGGDAMQSTNIPLPSSSFQPGVLTTADIDEAIIEAGGGPEESSSSDSSSDESSGSSRADERATALSVKYGSVSEVVVDGCTLYQHKKSKTIHLSPAGSNGGFVCGRQVQSEHVKLSHHIHAEAWVCKQCRTGRPIKEVGTLLAALDESAKRRRV